MFYHNHGQTLFPPKPIDHSIQFLATQRVKFGCGFIKHQNFRFQCQDSRQGQPLFLTARQFRSISVVKAV